jgi:hypothetical protein
MGPKGLSRGAVAPLVNPIDRNTTTGVIYKSKGERRPRVITFGPSRGAATPLVAPFGPKLHEPPHTASLWSVQVGMEVTLMQKC